MRMGNPLTPIAKVVYENVHEPIMKANGINTVDIFNKMPLGHDKDLPGSSYSYFSTFGKRQGTEVTLDELRSRENGTEWDIVPARRLEMSEDREDIGGGYGKKKDKKSDYVCGANACNKALKMWGYSKQVTRDNYPYTYFGGIRVGPRPSNYASNCIYRHFDADKVEVDTSDDIRWDIIDETDYSKQCVIVVGHLGCGGLGDAHYFMIVGVNCDKSKYIITDQEDRYFEIEYDRLKLYLKMDKQIGWSMTDRCGCFRVG